MVSVTLRVCRLGLMVLSLCETNQGQSDESTDSLDGSQPQDIAVPREDQATCSDQMPEFPFCQRDYQPGEPRIMQLMRIDHLWDVVTDSLDRKDKLNLAVTSSQIFAVTAHFFLRSQNQSYYSCRDDDLRVSW